MTRGNDLSERYFDGTNWTENPAGAILRLVRDKRYTYHDYSYNYIDQSDGNGGWEEIVRGSDAYKQLTGIQRGHIYEATPFEEQHTGAARWQVKSPLRIGDKSLAQFGIPREIVYKTDYDFASPLTDEQFNNFQQHILKIGGIVKIHQIDMVVLQDHVELATALYSQLDSLLAQAMALHGQIDATNISHLEQLHGQALLVNLEYQKEQEIVKTLVRKLKLEPKRANDKAQAGAWLLSLKEHPAVSGINGIQKEAIAEREIQLAGGQGTAFMDPRMAHLYVVLSQIYAPSSAISITFDGKETITLKKKTCGSLRLTPRDIE